MSEDDLSNRLVKVAEDSVRGGFFLFAGNALSTLTLAMGSIIVARLLGPENYGLYGLSLVAPSVFLLFTDFGVNSAITRFSAKLKSEGKVQLVADMLKSGFLFNLLTATAMFVACFTLSDRFATHILNRSGTGYLIRLGAFAVLFQAVLLTTKSTFLGLDRMQDNALTMNIESIVKVTSSPLLIFLGFSVVGALVGHLLGYVAAGIAGFIILLKHYRTLGGASRGNSFSGNLKVMVGYGFPLYISTLLGSLFGQYQIIILALFASNAEIGNLTVAMNFVALIGLLTFPINALFPAFSKLNPKSEEARKLFRLLVKYTSLYIVPAAIAIAILSRDLVDFIYGPNFSLAPRLLSIYILNYLCTGLGSIALSPLLSGVGETRLVLKANIINLSVFVPLAPALIWLCGVPGVIVAGIVSGLFSLTYQLSTARKRFGVNFNLGHSMKIYLASAISAIPTFLFLQTSPFQNLTNVILGGSLFLFTYLTLAPLLGAVSTPDVENIKLIFSKLKIVWPILKPVLAYEDKLLSTFTLRSIKSKRQ